MFTFQKVLYPIGEIKLPGKVAREGGLILVKCPRARIFDATVAKRHIGPATVNEYFAHAAAPNALKLINIFVTITRET